MHFSKTSRSLPDEDLERRDRKRPSLILFASPFLIASFPVISLFNRNGTLFDPLQLIEPLAVVAAAIAVISAVCYAAWRDLDKVLIFTSALAAIFWTSGFISTTFRDEPLRDFVALVALISAAALAVAVHRSRIDLRRLNLSVLVIALVLTGRPIYGLASAVAGERLDAAREKRLPAPDSPRPLPDVYYIVLDGYGRQDVLQELYAFDNEPFLRELEARGFSVLRDSRSNYSHTLQSLASSLNSVHLQRLTARSRLGTDRRLLEALEKNNDVSRRFRAHGYRIVSSGVGPWAGLVNSYADTSLLRRDVLLRDFNVLLLEWSPLSRLLDLDAISRRNYVRHHAAVKSSFAAVRELRPSRPSFVYVHVVAPHPPFVFDADGSLRPPDRPWSRSDADEFEGTRDEYISRYLDQVRFLNGEILRTVDALLAQSEVQPVIVLQSDHGPGVELRHYEPSLSNLWERMSILHAILAPPSATSRLYSSMTPVNTFRVLQSELLGEHLPLLPDHSFFVTPARPYVFLPIPPDRMKRGERRKSAMPPASQSR